MKRGAKSLTAALVFAFLLAGAACDERDDPSPPSATATPGPPLAPPSRSASPNVGAASPPATTPAIVEGPVAVALQPLVGGLERPTFVTGAGDGSGRLFVLEKEGRIRVVRDGQLMQQPFANLTGVVNSSGSEQCLLGLAFHPDFATNGRLFVAYTAKDGANTLAELRMSGDPDRADTSSLRVLIAIPDSRSNHNGGMVAFGPDGYLYFGTGDGGGGGDPDRNGQDRGALLAKLLRIDVDGGVPYAIPPTNPFVDEPGARPEVWAYGLRNPWRFSFDHLTGDLWIGDVGEGAREEIDFQPASSGGGEDYGWSIVEGTACFRPSSGCSTAGITMPVYDYSHDEGCSVTGGYVYRGAVQPRLTGRYLLVDYCEGVLKTIRPDGDGAWVVEEAGETTARISSFGQADDGELYAAGDDSGTIYHVVAR